MLKNGTYQILINLLYRKIGIMFLTAYYPDHKISNLTTAQTFNPWDILMRSLSPYFYYIQPTNVFYGLDLNPGRNIKFYVPT